MAKIVFFEVHPQDAYRINNMFPEHEIVIREDKLTEKTAQEVGNAEVISGMIYSTINEHILSFFPHLQFIATRSTGFDHIDLAACKKRNILVSNVPVYGAHTVAEHTFALILAVSRKLLPSFERTKIGDFSLEGLEGFDLFGKTLGVVGAGNIGKHVIDIALGFGMEVLVFTRTPDEKLVKDGKVSFVKLDTLLTQSDIITLHVPHTEETHHLINLQNIQTCKKGSILINTSRGAIVETEAILKGLEAGILAGVGLDVLEEECFLREETELLTSEFLKSCDIKTQLLNHVLLGRKEVVITPHNAFNSKEAINQIFKTTIENITSFLQGKPQNVLT